MWNEGLEFDSLLGYSYRKSVLDKVTSPDSRVKPRPIFYFLSKGKDMRIDFSSIPLGLYVAVGASFLVSCVVIYLCSKE